MQGLSLGVEDSGLVKWVSCRIRVSWVSFMYMYIYSGNVHASDCGSAHCSGCTIILYVVNGISAKTYSMLIYTSLLGQPIIFASKLRRC